MREAFAAWRRGDMDALAAMWDPSIVWDTTQMRDWPESDYRGKEGIERFLTEWLDVWDDYDFRVDDLIAAPDGRVVCLVRHRGKGRHSGVAMELEMAQVVTFHDGKIVRVENYDDRIEALNSAGLRG